jgi:hypothetical protein
VCSSRRCVGSAQRAAAQLPSITRRRPPQWCWGRPRESIPGADLPAADRPRVTGHPHQGVGLQCPTARTGRDRRRRRSREKGAGPYDRTIRPGPARAGPGPGHHPAGHRLRGHHSGRAPPAAG